MRTRHCLCAICGGPLRASRARISATPRTAGFLRRQEWRQREGESTSGDSDPDSQYDSSEERTYDPEILSDVQRRWLDTVHAIGYNPASPHVDKHVKHSILSLLLLLTRRRVFITPPGCPSFHVSLLILARTKEKKNLLQANRRGLSRSLFGQVIIRVWSMDTPRPTRS